MTKAQSRRFFLGGTVLFAAVFIALTLHTHTTLAERTNAEDLTDSVVRGLHVWADNNCEGCHTLMGEGAYYAPDLTKIVEQRGETYLAAFLADPSRFYSHERDRRLMPTLDLSSEDITDVIAFLEWVGNVDLNGWPPRPILVAGVSSRGVLTDESSASAPTDPVSVGQRIFNGAGGCAACHSVQSGVRLVGPSLAGAGVVARDRIAEPGYGGTAASPAEYLREAILEPSAHLVPGETFAVNGVSLMPASYGSTLSSEDVDALVAFLSTLQAVPAH